MNIAWGSVVSREFKNATIRMCERLAINPSHMMACMAFETGGAFRSNTRNAMGSGATGLIQFMPQTALALGTTTDALAAMTEVEQLVYVEKYFRPRKNRLRTLSDVYMAILWPAAIGKPEDFVLFDKADPRYPKRYVQNAGLDQDPDGKGPLRPDGKITKSECTAKVAKMLERGLTEFLG